MFNLFKKKKNDAQKMIDELPEKMVELRNRPTYQKLTKEIIESVPDENLEQAIFENISQIIGASAKDELMAVSELSLGQRASYAVWCVESEVNNGGFYQFFQNSSGIFGPMAVEGFKTFGANKFATLTEKANKLKDKFIEGDESLPDLDTEFYALYKEEDLNKLRIAYTRSHISDFV